KHRVFSASLSALSTVLWARRQISQNLLDHYKPCAYVGPSRCDRPSVLGLSPAAFASVEPACRPPGFDLWLGRTACATTPSSNWGRAWEPQVPPERKTSRSPSPPRPRPQR